MGLPETLRVGRALDKLGGAASEIAPRERLVAEDVAQPVAEPVAHLGDACIRRPAMRAGIAAIFDERNRRVVFSEHMVARGIDGPIEPVVEPPARHVYFSAAASRSTSSAWPGTLTLRQMPRITPLPSIRKVARSIPIYLRPYMLFSTQVP